MSFKWLIIHVSNQAAGGESKVKATAPITRMVQLHPTPHPSSTPSADILQAQRQAWISPPKTAGEEGLRKGWRRGHISPPPPPSRDACLFFPAASPTLSEQAQFQVRLCWELQVCSPGTHPAFQRGDTAGNARALKAKSQGQPSTGAAPHRGSECAAP